MHIDPCGNVLYSTLSTELFTLGTETVLRPCDPRSVAGCVRAGARRRVLHAAGRTLPDGEPSQAFWELEFLIRAVSSVTWLKIARRSFMSSEIFLLACMTVV
jgi:hypothetical protein